MDSGSGALPGPVVHDERPAGNRRVFAFLIVVTLIIIVGMLIADANNAAQTATLGEEAFLATNPEFLAVESYAAWHPQATTAQLLAHDAFLARNPELNAVARYTALGDNHEYLAQNPELSAVRRYAEVRAED